MSEGRGESKPKQEEDECETRPVGDWTPFQPKKERVFFLVKEADFYLFFISLCLVNCGVVHFHCRSVGYICIMTSRFFFKKH